METAILTKEQALVKEIHNAVDGEADRIVSEANVFLLNYEAKINSKRAEQLKALGFESVPEVKKIEAMNKNKETHETVLYYKKSYPFLKFITDEQLNRICKKYDLVYAPVSNYIGNVPQKNLDEIETTKIKSIDNRNNLYKYTIEDFHKVLSFKDSKIYDAHNLIKYAESKGMKYPYSAKQTMETIESYDNLMIAAPKSMFIFKGLKKLKNGFGFFKKHLPEKIIIANLDPIVFRYVKGGILIISKWGLEANDPELAVPELN